MEGRLNIPRDNTIDILLTGKEKISQNNNISEQLQLKPLNIEHSYDLYDEIDPGFASHK